MLGRRHGGGGNDEAVSGKLDVRRNGVLGLRRKNLGFKGYVFDGGIVDVIDVKKPKGTKISGSG